MWEGKTSSNIERTTSKNNYSPFFIYFTGFSFLQQLFFTRATLQPPKASIPKVPPPQRSHYTVSGRHKHPFFNLKCLPKHLLPLHSSRKCLYPDGKENVLSHWRWGYFVLLLRLITVLGGIKAPLISTRYPWEILHWLFL